MVIEEEHSTFISEPGPSFCGKAVAGKACERYSANGSVDGVACIRPQLLRRRENRKEPIGRSRASARALMTKDGG